LDKIRTSDFTREIVQKINILAYSGNVLRGIAESEPPRRLSMTQHLARIIGYSKEGNSLKRLIMAEWYQCYVDPSEKM
jgi:hypothetical protein